MSSCNSQYLKRSVMALLLGTTLSACNSMGNVLNPFYEAPGEIAMLGEKNDRALRGDLEKEDTARGALTAMASYRRAQAPEPVNPVVQPAVVRLMWVPDHLNKNGDLVPAHYYYLKVLNDRFAVQDAFELEAQLGGGATASDVPYVLDSEVKGK